MRARSELLNYVTKFYSKQSEGIHLGDCPICLLPLPIDARNSTMMECCSKQICKGCWQANLLREKEGRLRPKCPFCRHPAPMSMEEADMDTTKRAEANDPVAMRELGSVRYDEGDYDSAFEYWTKAAGFGGDSEAHFLLSALYDNGLCVEKDEKKKLNHLEEAAIAGHPKARHNLALVKREMVGLRGWRNISLLPPNLEMTSHWKY